MDFDALVLSRIQFAFTVSLHVIFPALTIGIAAFLVLVEGLWLATAKRPYRRLYRFWLKLFAICFALGVISGIPISFQFGTNWAPFAEATANVLGPLIGYHVFAALFLQTTFLAIMLFGQKLVGRGLHFAATCIVALGTLASTFWIMSANSWMHSPDGYELRDGVFYVTEWAAVIFNPSFLSRFLHMALAAGAASMFLIAGVGAWLLLRRRARVEALTMIRLAMGLACILVPLQFVSGHETGLSVYQTQPAKHAAIGGHWITHEGNAPLVLFAWPDQVLAQNQAEIAIPTIGSLVTTGSTSGTVYGLVEWAPEDRPNVPVVFMAFRIMVGIGLLMVLLAPLGAWGAWRGWLARSRITQAVFVLMLPSGLIAILAGWVTSEVGRQPFTVYGIMRTAESLAPITTEQVAVSLATFAVCYTLVFAFGIGMMMRIAGAGPQLPYTPAPDPLLVTPLLGAGTSDDAPWDDDDELADRDQADAGFDDDGSSENDWSDQDDDDNSKDRRRDPHQDTTDDDWSDPDDDVLDDENDGDDRRVDDLSDEELERLTAPERSGDDSNDEDPDDQTAVSAHDRLFMQDSGIDDDMPDDTETSDLPADEEERKDGNP